MNARFLPVLLAASLLLSACSSNTQSDKTTTDSSSVSQTTSPETAETLLTERLTNLGLTTESHWRGISLGDPIATVRATEKATLFESDAKHLGYTLEFPNLESADILYQLDAKQTVNGIEVDLYLNDAKAVSSYQTDLKRYFDARYKANGSNTWQGANKETVTLRDVSKGKDFGLKIVFRAGGAV
jgi:hypothetical protein